MEQCLVDIFSVIGVSATVIGVGVAAVQLSQANRNLRRSYSPILIVETTPPFVTFIASPVAQSIQFKLRNDGNGPALNVNIKVTQGEIEFERKAKPAGIPVSKLHRDSLAKGDELECFFRVPAEFEPPKEIMPVLIEIGCENIYSEEIRFYYEVPVNMFSPLQGALQKLLFKEMKEVREWCV